MRSHRRTTLTVALAVAGTFATLGAQQPAHVDTPRDQWQRVADISPELGATAGSHIADLGAGSGFFTSRLAESRRATGRVYAVDVNPVSLRELKETLGPDIRTSRSFAAMRTIRISRRPPRWRADRERVPRVRRVPGCWRASFGAQAGRTTGPGRADPAHRDTTRTAQTKRHTIAIEFAEADLKRAGFEILRPGTSPS